ncbi:MAG TPA: hypothetical protein VFU35_12175 [Jatrophihabitans sp.]|nr:hypothetical protein [Jatrophihabitans sp.]
MPATSRRKQTIGLLAAVVFVVGFALLYLQSHNAKNRLNDARDSVKANAARYTAAVVSALQAGPVTGQQLLDLREPAYQDGGGLAQGIEHVGGRNTAVGVTVTFRVQVNFKGSFNTSVDTSSCFRTTVTHSTAISIDPPPTIDCADLLPDIDPTAVLTLP